ncbi:protein maelstrom homolog [Oppia nitens]|uniref:protein maelstrom homolog n=1 Tax=Oppia nitens TaxID=1686743 RepID=UPI0023DA4A00|nr:protein maelstrom homolog [Oppia nitens]
MSSASSSSTPKLSNNKAFKLFLIQKARQMNASLKDTNFIIDMRNEWKMMSFSEKSVSVPMNDMNEVTNRSKELDDFDRENEIKPKNFAEMLVINMLKDKNKEELMDLPIYLMSSCIQCVVNETYLPLEIGIVEYTIKHGIRRTYHSFIKCGPIPCGYAYSAISHKDAYHKIPLGNFDLASDDFQAIGNAVLDLIKSGQKDFLKKNPRNSLVVFSAEDQIKQNQGVLKWLASKYTTTDDNNDSIYGNKSAQDWDIEVFDISCLLLEIFKQMGISRSPVECKNDMTNTCYDYSPDTDCNYHEDIECIYCGLGWAKRLAYMMSESLIKRLRFEPFPTHFPKREYVKFAYQHFFNCGQQPIDNNNNVDDGKEINWSKIFENEFKDKLKNDGSNH